MPSSGQMIHPCVEKPPLAVSHNSESSEWQYHLESCLCSLLDAFSQNRSSSIVAFWLQTFNTQHQAGPPKDSHWRVLHCFSLDVLYSRLGPTLTLIPVFDVDGKRCNIPFTPDSCTPIPPPFAASGKEIATHSTLKYTERDRVSLYMGNKPFSLNWGRQKSCGTWEDVWNISDIQM